MKAVGLLLGIAGVAAIGGVAYAMSHVKTHLTKGGVYLWGDKRGFDAQATKEQYESLGFASVSIAQGEDGWIVQGIWTLDDTYWDVPKGLTTPEHVGDVGGIQQQVRGG